MEPTIYQCTAPKALGNPAVARETILSTGAHDFNVIKVDPGAGKPPHPYDEGDSLMLVLDGLLHLKVDGQEFALTPGMLAMIPKGAARGFTAGLEGATFFAAHLRG